ncbi:hypothetical protein ACWDY4_38380 [Streptomyces olivaceoviridis]
MTADVANSLLQYVRAAAAAIRDCVAAVVDMASAAGDVTAAVLVMNDRDRGSLPLQVSL